MRPNVYDTVVLGGGAARIGVAVALKDAGIADFLVLEGRRVGSSFSAWPRETRFLTPSFPTNSVGMLDLNSTTIGTSPAPVWSWSTRPAGTTPSICDRSRGSSNCPSANRPSSFESPDSPTNSSSTPMKTRCGPGT